MPKLKSLIAIAKLVFTAFSLISVFGLISISVDYVTEFDPWAPPGQYWYYFSKVVGIFAVVLIVLQISVRHLGPSENLPYLAQRLRNAHGMIGSVILIACVVHAGAFVTGVSVRAGSIQWGILAPNFTHGYYKTMVTLGILALAALVTAIYFIVRKRSIQFHKVVYAASLLAVIHSVSIGSEKTVIYLIYTLAAVLLLLVIILRGRSAKVV